MQKADAIYLEEIRAAGLYDSIWQAFAVLLPVKTVGVMGDARTYEDVCALRAVTSTDGMTADFFEFPWAVLAKTATRIINEVKGINRVVYDVTIKAAWHDRVGVGTLALTIYGIKACDTIQKARDWLAGHGVAYDFHDYKVQGIDGRPSGGLVRGGRLGGAAQSRGHDLPRPARRQEARP